MKKPGNQARTRYNSYFIVAPNLQQFYGKGKQKLSESN
jgi:hypothetical protein